MPRSIGIIDFDTDSDIVFTTASMLIHQVFNSRPNKNRAYFKLRQQDHLG